MALPNFNINPYVQPFAGGVSKETGELMDRKIADYDFAAEGYDVLGYQTDTLLQNTLNKEGDQLYARDLMEKYRKEVDAATEQGDYENMGRQVKRLARTFAQEVQPLLENRKRVADWQEGLKKDFENNRIGLDTYQKSIKYSLDNYNGLDKNNIQGSMFQGFVPGKDYNVADGVNKFLATFKADKTKTFSVPTKDGSYITTNIETVGKLMKNGRISYDNMVEAAANYLAANTDFSSYRDTQITIGNSEKLQKELQSAVRAGVEAQGYTQVESDLKYAPVENLKYAKLQEILELPSVIQESPGVFNPQAIDQFETKGVKVDNDGIVRVSPDVIFEGGKYYTNFKNGKGEPISKAEYESAKQRTSVSGRFAGEGLGDYAVTATEISLDEAEKYQEEVNNDITILAKNNYIKELFRDAAKNNLNFDALLNDPTQLNKTLNSQQSNWNSPQKRKQAAKEYQEAIKNSAVFYGNQVATFSNKFGGVNEKVGITDPMETIANLSGKSVAKISALKGEAGYRNGEQKDIQSLLNEEQKDGSKFIGSSRFGAVAYNPFERDKSAIQEQLFFEKDNKIKIVTVLVPYDDPDYIPSQRVHQFLINGKSGDVDFRIANPDFNENLPPSESNPPTVYGKLRVNSYTDKNERRESIFNGFIEVLDANGNKVISPSIPQNITGEEFFDVWNKYFVPKAINKYISVKELMKNQ
jgi:hypothetical protein